MFKKGGDQEAIRRIQAGADRNIRRYNLVDDEDYDLATERFVEFEEARYGFRKPFDEFDEGATEQTDATSTQGEYSAGTQTRADGAANVKAGEGAGKADKQGQN